MYELVPEMVLVLIVYGTMALPSALFMLASLYFWIRHKIGDKDG